MSNFITTV